MNEPIGLERENMERKVNKIANFGKVIWLYTKYQLITKGLLFLVVFPLSTFIMKLLLQSTGRTNISSGDYLRFLFSVQGVGLLILGLALLTILVGTDINAFIIMSALIKEGRIKMTAKHLLVVGLRSIKTFLKPAGFLLMFYWVIVIPLVGIGFTIAPMQGFEIPNFITDVIFKNPLYSSLYLVAILILTIVTVLHLFTFHYILICNQKIGEGLRNARLLMKKHWKSFLVDFLLRSLLRIVFLFAFFMIAIFLLIFMAYRYTQDIIVSRAILIWGILLLGEIIAFVVFLTVPIMIERLTELFYRYNLKEGNPIQLKIEVNASIPGEEAFAKIKLRTKMILTLLIVGLLTINFVIASFCAIFFDEIFRNHRKIEIVAHRGGGDLAAENSIASLEEAIKAGVAWSEIDVQRTKDGKYIINHDPTFQRVTGVPRSSTDMTLEEIKQLRINDLFDSSRPSQEVPTMEEFLDAAKGRIGLFIELKGSTADPQMADDVIAMVKERDMLKEIAILSLDYSLIQYVEENYPEVDTGFLYFFSLGETSKMKGDFLIMEEKEATPQKVAEIQNAGKRAIVWTVNTESSIDQFVNSNVDGIITDYVLKVKEGMNRRDNRQDFEIIIDSFLN